jgi:hypothetical protein
VEIPLGIVPDNELPLRSKYVKLWKSPIELGKVPFSVINGRLMDRTLANSEVPTIFPQVTPVNEHQKGCVVYKLRRTDLTISST